MYSNGMCAAPVADKTYYMLYVDGECITDGFDRAKVIKKAEAYFENKFLEDGYEGDLTIDAVLKIDHGAVYTEQAVKLNIYIDKSDYDHGEWDYYNSR